MWRAASWAEVHEDVGRGGLHASRFEEDEAASSAVRPPSLASFLHLQLLALNLHFLDSSGKYLQDARDNG